MTYINTNELADQLSPEQFELLLRAYIKKQVDQCEVNPQLLMLVATTGYGKETIMGDCKWTIGYSSSDQTKGEILALCVTEYNRRNAFAASCTLRLIEHQQEHQQEQDEEGVVSL